MVEKLKAFTQSEMMVVYKAVIGTGVFIGILFIGGLLVEMRDNDKEALTAIQKLGENYVSVAKDIEYVKRDMAEMAKCVDENQRGIHNNHKDIQVLRTK